MLFSFSFSVCDINKCLTEMHVEGGSEWDWLRICVIASCPFNVVEPRFILSENYAFVINVVNEQYCLLLVVLCGTFL